MNFNDSFIFIDSSARKNESGFKFPAFGCWIFGPTAAAIANIVKVRRCQNEERKRKRNRRDEEEEEERPRVAKRGETYIDLVALESCQQIGQERVLIERIEQHRIRHTHLATDPSITHNTWKSKKQRERERERERKREKERERFSKSVILDAWHLLNGSKRSNHLKSVDSVLNLLEKLLTILWQLAMAMCSNQPPILFRNGAWIIHWQADVYLPFALFNAIVILNWSSVLSLKWTWDSIGCRHHCSFFQSEFLTEWNSGRQINIPIRVLYSPTINSMRYLPVTWIELRRFNDGGR